MASSLSRLGFAALRGACRIRPRWAFKPCIASSALHTTSSIRRDDRPRARPGLVPSDDDEELEDGGELPTPEEMAEYQAIFDNPPPELREVIEGFKSRASAIEAQALHEYEMEAEPDMESSPDPRFRPGLMSMGEVDEEDAGEDEPFEGDDMTSLAHGELEQHREIREYARIAAWEMPLLAKHAKPFEPPALDRPLRFRHTTYMGERHPAEKKIVLEFCTSDLPLTPRQRLKLVKLAGVRYDPQTDVVKMSCEMFETQAQNKRYLGDLVDTLMAEARNEVSEEGGKDSFDDVPVDFRHVRWKRRLAFPEAWKMTDQRRQELEAERSDRTLRETGRIQAGLLVDGRAVIDEALKRAPMLEQVIVEQARIGKGKGSKHR